MENAGFLSPLPSGPKVIDGNEGSSLQGYLGVCTSTRTAASRKQNIGLGWLSAIVFVVVDRVLRGRYEMRLLALFDRIGE